MSYVVLSSCVEIQVLRQALQVVTECSHVSVMCFGNEDGDKVCPQVAQSRLVDFWNLARALVLDTRFSGATTGARRSGAGGAFEA